MGRNGNRAEAQRRSTQKVGMRDDKGDKDTVNGIAVWYTQLYEIYGVKGEENNTTYKPMTIAEVAQRLGRKSGEEVEGDSVEENIAGEAGEARENQNTPSNI